MNPGDATESGRGRMSKGHVPIKVTTNGLSSRDKAFIHVDVRVIENGGYPIP